MVAVSDFSGLMSSAWALAKTEASAATDSLDRGMGRLRLQHIKAHRARFGALCLHAMPNGLLSIFGHQGRSSRMTVKGLTRSRASSARGRALSVPVSCA